MDCVFVADINQKKEKCERGSYTFVVISTLFSKRKANQLMWDRFVNTKGLVGCNIPTDLHMEHLNRRLKTLIRNISANINPRTITQAAKSIGVHRVKVYRMH